MQSSAAHSAEQTVCEFCTSRGHEWTQALRRDAHCDFNIAAPQPHAEHLHAVAPTSCVMALHIAWTGQWVSCTLGMTSAPCSHPLAAAFVMLKNCGDPVGMPAQHCSGARAQTARPYAS